MIKNLKSIDEYQEFIHSFFNDENFSDPMLTSKEQIQCNLLSSVNKPNDIVLGVFSGENIIGLFVFLIEKGEGYSEMIVGLSREEKAYNEVLEYLAANYSGFKCDFVYNPKNYLLHSALVARNALFEKEQIKLRLESYVEYPSNLRIELLSEQFYQQYTDIHSTNIYWTADKIIAAKDRFKTLVAIDNERVVGYIDFTYRFNENEPYDLFVLPQYRGMKYGKSLVSKAIELNRPKGMMLLSDIDNQIAINLYKSLGFVVVNGENNITAHLAL